MSGRKPRQDELELWQKVAKNVNRVEKPMSEVVESGFDPKPVLTPEFKSPLAVPKLNGGKTPLRNDLAPSLQAGLRDQPVQMDRKTFKTMQRGKLKPDGRIDLHGMTLDRAHTALTRFVLNAHGSGKRLLLVITGKGKHRDEGGPIPVRFGVLRHQVPEWLRLPPLSGVVLQVTQAHVSHGGAGAYYVYLKRAR